MLAAVILVHGFTGGPQNWDPMLGLLRADSDVAERFEFHVFAYPTRLFQLSLKRRIPPVDELANALAEFYDSTQFRDREVILVGHSQGGLVVQQFLASMVQQARARELQPIRQAIFFATPLGGSEFLSGARRFIFGLLPNPQERSLRVLAKETAAAQVVVRDRIAGATTVGPTECPIPIKCFWGMEDNIVPAQSAQGSYRDGSAIPGDHSGIIQPPDPSDSRYSEFKEALLDPIGHPGVFEVEEYENSISIKPLPPGTKVKCTYDHGTRTVRSDTKGIIRQRVKFARKNRCEEPFALRYGTEEDGAIQANTSHQNEAGAEELESYRARGTAYVFRFQPEPGEEYWLQAVAYKAFDKGNEDLHLHLRKSDQDSRYRRVVFQLDLTRYLESGNGLNEPAVLHFRRADPGDHSDCVAPAMGDILPPVTGTEPGVWRWEISDVSKGVVDLRWRRTLVAPSPETPPASDENRTPNPTA